MNGNQLGPTPLASAWTKFVRASEHRCLLEPKLDAFLDEHPKGVTAKGEVEWDRPPLRSVLFSVESVPEFPLPLGAMVGDVVHNLRSALDHLAWQLVKRGSDPRPEKPRRVQFPLATSAGSFDTQLKERLPGVKTRPHAALIRRFQPYRSDLRGRGIRALRSFNDTDKHRVLVPTVINASSAGLKIVAPGAASLQGSVLLSGARALKPGAPVARAVVTGQGTDYEVRMNGKLAVEPSLGYGRPASPLLRHIEAVVFELLDSFDRIELGSRYRPAIPRLSIDVGSHSAALDGLI